jgi:hypothetical protein
MIIVCYNNPINPLSDFPQGGKVNNFSFPLGEGWEESEKTKKFDFYTI